MIFDIFLLMLLLFLAYVLIRCFILIFKCIHYKIFYKIENVNEYFAFEYKKHNPKYFKICMVCPKILHKRPYTHRNYHEFSKCLDSLHKHLKPNTAYRFDTHKFIYDKIEVMCENKNIDLNYEIKGKMCIKGYEKMLKGNKSLGGLITALSSLGLYPRVTTRYKVVIKVL